MIFCINSFLPFLWLFVEQLQMFLPMAGLVARCTGWWMLGKLTRKLEYKLQQSGHLISHLLTSHLRSQPQTVSSLDAMDYICNKIKISSLHNW